MPHDPRPLSERQALALDKFDRAADLAIRRGDALSEILKTAQATADIFMVDRGELVQAWADLQERRTRGEAPRLTPTMLDPKPNKEA